MSNVADDSFRDTIGTVDEDGKRKWVYPKKPSDWFYDKRKWVSYILLAVLLSSPFIKINGNQLFLFNVLERKFSIFGFTFWPQDFYIVVVAMIICVVFIALFTVAFGRVFCGWICPQTIFMEMVFRRIEYWIEGDRGAQIRLNKQEWNAEKIRKKGFKWLIFFIISFVIANVFLAYIVGSDQVLAMIIHGPFEHLSTFIALLIFTGVFYFVFAWFREQVCIIACPYGRMQSVLLDEKSVVVAYDYVRGEGSEGRSKFRKNESREEKGYGDCIDCNQCVEVCPTGIDIRNGTQLECVNCTACIDACDYMMESVGLPKGLIRYDSEDAIVNKESKKLTPRSIGYSIVLVLIMGLITFLLLSRTDVDITVLKTPGQQYQKRENNQVSNLYNYKVINKTFNEIPAEIKLIEGNGEVEYIGGENDFIIPSESMTEGTFFLVRNMEDLEDRKSIIYLGVYNKEGVLLDKVKTSFLAPVKRKK